MRSRALLVALGLAALTCVWAVQADEPAKGGQSKGDSAAAKFKEDLLLREQQLKAQYAEFEQAMLKLMQRLRLSENPEDKTRADVLERALKLVEKESISTKFEQMVEFLRTQKGGSLGNVRESADKAAGLAKALQGVLETLRQDARIDQIKEEKKRLTEMLKKLEKIIHDQKVLITRTERGTGDPKAIGKDQKPVSEAAKKLADQLGQLGGAQAKNEQGASKPGGKNAGKGAEGKNAGKGEGQKANGKGQGNGQGKPGEAKPSAGKGGSQGSKGGQAKAGGKGGQGAAKAGGKGGDQAGKKGNEGGQKGKEGQAKDQGNPSKVRDKQPGEAKKPESDNKNDKAGSKKGGEGAKAGGAKSSPSGSKAGSQPKAGGSPSKSGESKGGSSSSGQGQSKSGKAGGGGGQQKPGPQQPPQAKQPDNGHKQVEEGHEKQNQAEQKLKKQDPKGAADEMEKANDKFEQARKKLEELLNQLREEELERLLANLTARCQKMLDMQIAVYQGTQALEKQIQANSAKVPLPENRTRGVRLSDDEKAIAEEADKAIQMLQAEGSAIAFPEVFEQVAQDMRHVQRRLFITDSGKVTQAIEVDIIDSLKDMIDALKKAQQDNKNKSKPGKSGKSGKQDQKLLDKIAELKMIRAMQIRVNGRTKTYGQQYEGEQAQEPRIQEELRNLSSRQVRIFEVTNRIAKGDNK